MSRDNCEDCADLIAAARDARARRLLAEEDVLATQRAYEDHEATHGWKAPRKWDDGARVAYTYPHTAVVRCHPGAPAADHAWSDDGACRACGVEWDAVTS
jgi:hypothetical protein